MRNVLLQFFIGAIRLQMLKLLQHYHIDYDKLSSIESAPFFFSGCIHNADCSPLEPRHICFEWVADEIARSSWQTASLLLMHDIVFN